MDNLSLYPPGVGPQDDFDFPNSGKSKLIKDPRLAKQDTITSDLDKAKRLINNTGPKSPSRDRYDKADRDRSRERSPKRGRDHYRDDRYDREDSYERRSSHRGRRTPSPPSPQPKRSRSSQYNRGTYRDQSDSQFMERTQMYSGNNYPNQTYNQPPPYTNQSVQFPAYMQQNSTGSDGFLNAPGVTSYLTPNYIPTAPSHAPPTMMGGIMNAPPPTETTDSQWIPLQPTQPPSAQNSGANSVDKIKREAAIASEMRQQKATLVRQREEYLRKVNNLKRELQVLKDQRSELKGSTRTPPSPDSYRFLKENAKLQVEIGNKLKTMNNVIDMLSGIIGEEASAADRERKKSVEKSGARTPSSSPERRNKEDRGFSSDRNSKQAFNYIHYDPEMHWCQVCSVFPKTAKEYLNHLHDPEHLLNVETGPGLEAPWHQILTEEDEEPPAIPGAQTKRLPIRGLQHFTATSAWFCKLCNKWIGDLHCASAHLKSKGHAKAYTRFTEQNPHWETDWMADRQKAYERSCSTNPEKFNPDTSATQNSSTVVPVETPDGGKSKKKKKEKKNKKKSKKHKRSKSSSSETSTESESDSSDKLSDKAASIRVAMRNKLKQHAAELLLNEKAANAGKWMSEKTVEKTPIKKEEPPQKPERDDKMLMQWMANKGVISDSDKKMFETLRNRLKTRQENEAAAAAAAANKGAEFQKVKPQPSVIPLIREQEANKQREAQEAQAAREREKYEAERENESREMAEKERDRGRDRDYYKGRDRDYYKDREARSYYRDRKRSPGEYRNRYYDKRYSRSPDRRHYRSRSPEHRSRVEVGVITNPPPAPKPPKYEKKPKYKQDHDSSDEKEKSKFKRANAQQQQQNKKLPFIGRMPVFKVKQKDDSPKNNADEEGDKKTGLEKAIAKRDEINAQIQKAMQTAAMNMTAPPPPSFSMDNSDAPKPPSFTDIAPPPPNITYEDPPIGFVTQQELPPGIESPSALEEIKIPPSVAHPNKQLPKDFADALDIIFPDENRKKPEEASSGENVPVPPPPMIPMPMMVPQYGMEVPQYSDYTFALPPVGYEQPPVAVPPPIPEEPVVKPVEERKINPEMDDLAMLGIDESDITAQHF